MLFYVYPLLAGLRVICQKYLWNVEWWGGKFYIGPAVCGITIYLQSTIQLSSPTRRRCLAKRVFENTPYVCLCYIYTMYVCTGLTFYFTSCFSVLSWCLHVFYYLLCTCQRWQIKMFNQSINGSFNKSHALQLQINCTHLTPHSHIYTNLSGHGTSSWVLKHCILIVAGLILL